MAVIKYERKYVAGPHMTKNQAIYSLHINASSVYILRPSGTKKNFGIQNVPDPIFLSPKRKNTNLVMWD